MNPAHPYNSRPRQIFVKGFSTSVGAQILAACVSVISIPLGIGYFGAEVYGVWLVLFSLLGYLNSSQFGIGMATTTLIAKEKSGSEQQKILSISFTFLNLISLVFIPIILFFGREKQNWVLIWGGVSPTLQKLAISCSFFMAILFFLKLPTVVFSSALIGLQKTHWERVYTIVLPSLFGFIALLITIWAKGDLLLLTVLTGVANLIVGIIGGCHVVITYKYLRPNWALHAANWVLVKEVFHSGRRFFVLSFSALVVWNTDNLVINHFLGPTYVSAYAITFKLFTLATTLLFTVNSILWPMYGRAMSENNWDWIKKLYNNTTAILALLGGGVCIGGVLFAHEIIKLWVGPSGYGGVLVVIALGLYSYLVSINNNHATLLSGINATKGMVWIGVLEAIANLGLSIILIQYFGIGGVALGTLLAALVTISWLLPYEVSQSTNSRVSMHWKQIGKHALFVVVPLVIVASILNGHFSSMWLNIVFKTLIFICYLVFSLRMMPSNVIEQIKELFMSTILRRSSLNL